MPTFEPAIRQVQSGHDLSAEQMSDLLDEMLSGQAGDDEIGRLLLALCDKGESVSELVGAATAMRRHMTVIPHHHPLLLDTCGTGGSGSGTFNISTAVAIVAAACGVAVAKHGNRRATSRSGSADVLEILGVKIESEPHAVAKRLDEIGICFCFARTLHPAMRHVADVRRKLGVRTLFNLLGPLCNPAGATHQLLGTVDRESQAKIAATIAELGTVGSFVIHADDGQDEVSLAGLTDVIAISGGTSSATQWTAADFGLLPAGREALSAADPKESARILQRIFAGAPGACRDTVLAGTAAALMLVGQVDGLKAGVERAAEAIDSGKANETLNALRAR